MPTAYNLKDIEFLIVDDNPVMQRIVKTILRAFGVNNPRVASSAAEAIQALRNQPSDIAIIDIDISQSLKEELSMKAAANAQKPSSVVPNSDDTGGDAGDSGSNHSGDDDLGGGDGKESETHNPATEINDGNELIRQLRTEETSPAPFIQIIVLTAHSAKEKVTYSRDSGMNEFLVKPISPLTLYKAIERIIQRPRPFVRLEGYTGPCRRRRKNSDGKEEELRAEDDITFIPDDTFPWNYTP
ncbi:response regulator [Kiloniella antarctica]|uniref:Response regulator n=1 Tax=Kiloniella antarctica TaxID=1550907 RepID=A0ABW5BJ17_9PROT